MGDPPNQVSNTKTFSVSHLLEIRHCKQAVLTEGCPHLGGWVFQETEPRTVLVISFICTMFPCSLPKHRSPHPFWTFLILQHQASQLQANRNMEHVPGMPLELAQWETTRDLLLSKKNRAGKGLRLPSPVLVPQAICRIYPELTEVQPACPCTGLGGRF